MPGNRVTELESLLNTLFGEDELFDLLKRTVDDDRVAAEVRRRLPAQGTAPAQVTSALVDALEKRGMIDAAFFEAVREKRPRREDEIQAVAEAWDVQPAVAPQTADAWLYVALQLDRSKPWGALKNFCAGNGHAVFVVHGSRQQNLKYFVSRVRRFLVGECRDRPHQLVPLPLRQENQVPRDAAEWEIRLKRALPARSGNTAEQLREGARRSALLLVLGDHPIAPYDLGAAEQQALQDFLTASLPALLARARPAHPVRLLLALEDPQQGGALQEKLATAFEAARGDTTCACRLPPPGMERPTHCRLRSLPRERPALCCTVLPEVASVGWTDIVAYLDRRPGIANEVYDQLHTIWHDHAFAQASYDDVVDLVSRFVQPAAP